MSDTVVSNPELIAETATGDYCLTPDGYIDARAQTNVWAKEVAEALQQEINTDDPTFCAGLVLMAGGPLNFRFGKVSHFTGLPRRFCQRVIQNLGYSRLLFKKQIAGDLRDELEKPDAEKDNFSIQMLFVLYCLAGSGKIRCDRGLWVAMPPCDVPFYDVPDVKSYC